MNPIWWVVLALAAVAALLCVGIAIGLALAASQEPPGGQGEIAFTIGPVKEQHPDG